MQDALLNSSLKAEALKNLGAKFSIPCPVAPWKSKAISDIMRIAASGDFLFRKDTKTTEIFKVIFEKSIPRPLPFLKISVLGSATSDKTCLYFLLKFGFTIRKTRL